MVPARIANTPNALRKGVVRALPFEGGDEALVEGLRSGHAPAIAVFCDRHGEHVRRLLGRILGADSELPDLHHDVFVRAIESLHTLRDARNLRGWITVIAVNTARSALKRRARRRWFGLTPAAGEVPEPAGEVDEDTAEALARTYRVLDRLPADERVAFTLRFIDEMELTEVADACAVSLATIKRRLARAQERFVALARRDEVLCSWLAEGDRWT
jgi:RNA polymerase sigma-70 factor (ECF subfamily)